MGINRKLNVTRKELEFLSTYDPKLGSGVRLKGSDYVAPITTGAGIAAPGSVLLDVLVSPGEFDSTRVQQIAALFERYRVRSWTFWYIPAVPSTIAGQILAYPDYDVADSLGTLPLNEAMAHMGSQLFNVYTETPIQFDRVDPYTDLFTDAEGADPRLTYVGRLRYLTAVALQASTTFGTIYMEYDIDFYLPQLQTGTLSVTAPDVFLKTVASSAVNVATGSNVPGLALDNLAVGTSLQNYGSGNIFSAIFRSDAASPGTTLDGSTFSGAGVLNVAQQIFFKIVAGLPNNGGTVPNLAYCTAYRSLPEAEADTPVQTVFTSSYITAIISLMRLLNNSGAAIAPGALLGSLSQIRLLPFSRFDKLTY